MQSPIGWLRAKRLARNDRRRRWATAIAPDPADPDEFAPVVRLFERELTSALAAAGFQWQNRTVHTGQPDNWVAFEVAGTELEVWAGPLMAGVNRPGLEARFEAVDFRTPEAFCAAVVARTVAEARRLTSA
jgi:hypothetical protein